MLKTKRVYEPADGVRFLVDWLWPRGMKKEEVMMKAWLKEVAPSPSLRSWHGHDPEKWEQFQQRYRAGLESNPESWQTLLEEARRGDITLLYSARHMEHNSALLVNY